MILIKNDFCYEKSIIFGHSRKKKKIVNSAPLLSFSFSPSIKECMYSEHTHTQTHSKRVCKFIPLWRTGGTNPLPRCYFLLFCSTSLIFSSFFVGGKRTPSPPSPVFSYWLHWPSSSPNTCTSFFGALITLSLHANKCKSFFSLQAFFFFSSAGSPGSLSSLSLSPVKKKKKNGQAQTQQVKRQHGVSGGEK